MIQEVSDAYGAELTSEMVFHAFEKEYLLNINGYYLKSFNVLKRHFDKDEESWWGAGVDTDIIVASIKSLLSALNRSAANRTRSRSC